MIKLLILDFDGTLLDLKNIHFQALNMALEKVGLSPISLWDHIQKFDGLPTSKKLEMLDISENIVNDISFYKQKFTLELMENIQPTHIKNEIEKLKKEFSIRICSNASFETICKGLQKLKINAENITIESCQDLPKPHSNTFLYAMEKEQVNPDETLIIEDSKKGLEGALRSGAYVYAVGNSSQFRADKIIEFAKKCKPRTYKYPGKSNINVLIPMAGAGSRFKQAGYEMPKPLIPVGNKTMIQTVVENLNIDANYIFICQKEHYEKYNLANYLDLLVPGCTIITTNGLTQGAACTSLLAKEFINNDKHLIIANSDQFLEWNSWDFIYNMVYNEVDGGIVTFESNHPKWSYALTDEFNNVKKVAEKVVISNQATVGIYFYRKGSDYIKWAERMISKDIRTNGEFYICPAFNEAIADGKKVKTFPIDKIFGLGVPEDLEEFKKHNGI